jgi:hypothetical protein
MHPPLHSLPVQHFLHLLPPQSSVPPGQSPAVQVPLTQAPFLSPTLPHSELVQHFLQLLLPQSRVPLGQAYWQVPPTQVAFLSPRPVHWPLSQHSWQVPSEQRWRFPLHLRSQRVPSQVAVALPDMGQALHALVPQDPTLLLSLHSSPQR